MDKPLSISASSSRGKKLDRNGHEQLAVLLQWFPALSRSRLTSGAKWTNEHTGHRVAIAAQALDPDLSVLDEEFNFDSSPCDSPSAIASSR